MRCVDWIADRRQRRIDAWLDGLQAEQRLAPGGVDAPTDLLRKPRGRIKHKDDEALVNALAMAVRTLREIADPMGPDPEQLAIETLAALAPAVEEQR